MKKHMTPTEPEKKTKLPKKRADYNKPTVTRHGNLKKITALSFDPPD